MATKKSKTTSLQPVTVGVIGFGTVGQGVVNYFQKGEGKKFDIHLKKVAVGNTQKKREISFPHITGNAEEILDDSTIDIVVEVMGGVEKAKEYITSAIKQKKSVVTANKAVLSRFSKELFTLARKNSVDLAFEASVGGGIPIIRTLLGLKGEKIDKVMGILNGTTNYILTQMEEGLEFEQALKLAQKKGFAEANHILDTGGFDTRDKIAILASLIYNTHIDPEKIPCAGITDITQVDLDFAKKYGVEEGGKGYAIKLLAIAERLDTNQVSLRVSPVLIPMQHPLSGVRNEFNALFIQGELAGEQLYSGRGAGRNATTSAVISDIIRVAQNIRNGKSDQLPTLDAKINMLNPDNLIVEGYIRANLTHKPGSAAQTFGILAKHKLNVKDSLQRKSFAQTVKGETFIPDIITLEKVKQESIQKAIKALSESQHVHGTPFFMPFV